MNKQKRKGFTIVELVIVIAVIAILSAVLIPTFAGVTDNAQNTADKQAARNAYVEYVGACENGEFEENVIVKIGDDKYFTIVNGQVGVATTQPANSHVLFEDEEGNAKVWCMGAVDELPEAVDSSDSDGNGYCDNCGKEISVAP